MAIDFTRAPILALLIIGVPTGIVFLYWYLRRTKPATGGAILGNWMWDLIGVQAPIQGLTSIATDALFNSMDLATISQFAHSTLTGEEAKDITVAKLQEFLTGAFPHWYGVREEVPRQSARELAKKTLMLSTNDLAPPSPYSSVIQGKSRYVLPGISRPDLRVLGYGLELGSTGEWNIIFVFPFNLETTQIANYEQIIPKLRELGQVIPMIRKAAMSIEENVALRQERDDLKQHNARQIAENARLTSENQRLQKAANRGRLGEGAELSPEPFSIGSFPILAMLGIFLLGAEAGKYLLLPQGWVESTAFIVGGGAAILAFVAFQRYRGKKIL